MIGAIVAGTLSEGTIPSPIPTANLYRWYDASNAASIISSAGSVSQWNDISGNGGTATNGTLVQQPTTGTTTQNGKNVLVSTVSSLYDTVSITSNALTYFIVANKTSAGVATQTYSRVMSLWKSPGGLDYSGTDSAAGFYANAAFGGFNPSTVFYRNSSVADAASVTFNQANQTTFRINGTSADMWHNGTKYTGSTSATNLDANRMTLFNAYDAIAGGAGDSSLNGWIAEVIVYRAALSDSDVSAVNTYLKTKWGTV